MQTTTNILMVRPCHFGFNAQTSESNSFQLGTPSLTPEEIQTQALKEFDELVVKLKAAGISVHITEDPKEPYTPDSIFPNNWFSTHEDGTIVLYPMMAASRRQERTTGVLEFLKASFCVKPEMIDLSKHEETYQFLEGTGSMVLDRKNKIAFACLSPRTDLKVFEDFCKQMEYTGVTFKAFDLKHKPLYHTNVMMSMADKYAVVCLDAIPDPMERANILITLRRCEKTVITITLAQMNAFAGNVIQIRNKDGRPFLVMSETAYKSLSSSQVTSLSQFNDIISADVSTIEKNGGGSVRCMIAEIFLPEKLVG